MIATEFHKKLASVSGYRLSRHKFAEEVLQSEELFPLLLQLCFQTEDKNYFRACWILELVLEKKLRWMENHLDYFCAGLKNLQDQRAIRSISKCCLYLAQAHFQKSELKLSEPQLKDLSENCFDWLIGDGKVASKVYAIHSLDLLGKAFGWITADLNNIVSKDFSLQSPAYRVAARKVLNKTKYYVLRQEAK